MNDKDDTASVSKQIIGFTGTDGLNISKILSKNVVVKSVSKIIDKELPGIVLKDSVIDYSWEEEYFTGSTFAIHVSGNYIAYGVKVNVDKTRIRVWNYPTMQKQLINLLNSPVHDIAFSYKMSPVLLGVISKSRVFVYKIIDQDEDCNKFKLELYIEIIRPASFTLKQLGWCPFVPPEDGEDEGVDNNDYYGILTIFTDTLLEIWNVNILEANHGSESSVLEGSLGEEYVRIKCGDVIKQVCFAPDASTLAVCMNKSVAFYQVTMKTEPNFVLLHEWEPHSGKTLTMIHFLDDKKSFDAQVFWKYAITGANCNKEIKIWTCDEWRCLQTLTFDREDTEAFQVSLDFTAEYLFLYNTKVMYVVHIDKTCEKAAAMYIAEFCFSSPISSFGILNVNRQPKDDYRKNDDSYVTSIEMLAIVPKQIKNYTISYPVSLPSIRASNQPNSNNDGIINGNDSVLSEAVTKFLNTSNKCNDVLLNDDVTKTRDLEDEDSSVSDGNSEVQDILFASGEDNSPEEDSDHEDESWPDTENLTTAYFSALLNRSQNTDSQPAVTVNRLLEEMNEIKKVLTEHGNNISAMKTAIFDYNSQMAQNISKNETFLKNVAHEHSNQLPKIVQENVQTTMTDILENTILPSIKRNISSEMNNISKEVRIELEKKINRIDSITKSDLSNFISDPVTAETLGHSLASVLFPMLSASFNNIFEKDLFPFFRTCCQNIFDRIDSTFAVGIKELMESFKQHTSSLVEKNAGNATTSTEEEISKFKDALTEQMKNLTLSIDGIKPAILEATKKTTVEQMNILQKYLNSLSNKNEVQNKTLLNDTLLQVAVSGDLNRAFSKALLNESVIFLCENLDVDYVFADTSKFQQRIILLLIKKLTMDFSVKTDLKLKYLERALMSLNKDDPTLDKEVLTSNISASISDLSNFISNKPKAYKHLTAIKILIMALKSLLLSQSDLQIV